MNSACNRRWQGVGHVAAAAALVTTIIGSFVIVRAGQPAPASEPSVVRGQTATRLVDGRWLFVGGDGHEYATLTWDPTTGRIAPARDLRAPRSGHSATVLPDGRILILGGRSGTALADIAEVFDPTTDTFSLLPMVGATARAGHTANLLTDGRVAVVGGSAGSAVPLPTEIWDLPRQSATAIPSATVDRVDHTATLRADGQVEIRGGRPLGGDRPDADIVLDTASLTIKPAALMTSTPTLPAVAQTIPAPDATEVPLVTSLTVRFSEAMAAESLSAHTVWLHGPTGRVTTRLVVAEDGRLVFLWPESPLEEDTAYTLTVRGAADQRGFATVTRSIRFTTARRDAPTAPAVPEEWIPDSTSVARGWRSDRPASPWATLPPLRAAAGVTAVAGQVLALDGRPLPNVTLALEGDDVSVRTDRTGRFLLTPRDASGGRRILVIEGASANKSGRTYGFFEWGLDLQAGHTYVLPFTIWMPKLDTQHAVPIPSPTTQETVITTPLMPGFELHLPAGTVIRDEAGQPVRSVSITPIPLDRTPFPLPEDATFRMYFTIQPGGAYLQTPGPIRGGWLVYPNVSTGPVGKRVQFFDYDPDDKGWFVYGMGTVTPTQVVPDPRVRLYGFHGASFNDGQTPPPAGATPDGETEGDPVDVSTGTFVMTKTDLVVPDVVPLSLTRTYNSKDPYGRAFGTGMMHAYATFLHTELLGQEADLILPEGGKIHYVRVSPSGTPLLQTVFEHTSSPTAFYKSRISFNGSGWELRLVDGTVYVFGHAAPLQKIRDRYGNEIRLTWSGTNAYGSGNGNIVRMTSPSGRWIALTYVAGTSRVSQATDNLGRSVTYTYDAAGNLSTVADPVGNVTTYGWNAANQLISIKDGRNIVYLTNEYTGGRVTKQTLASGGTYQFAYTVDGSGNVTQTDVTNPRGYVKRYSFNATHRTTSLTEAVGTSLARTTTTERQSGTDFPTATVDALGRRSERTFDVTSGRLLSTTQLAGTANAITTTHTYEPVFKQPASITDPLGHTWTTTYDGTGRVTGASDPLGHQRTITMNAAGQVTTTTDPLNHTVQRTYFGYDLRSVTDAVGATTTVFVDAGGRIVTVADPLGRVTQAGYDNWHRVNTLTDARGGQTTLSYDPNGRLLALTDALSHATSYAYDTSDRAATRTDPLARTDSYSYDGNDNLTQVTDRKSQATTWQYDALDRVSQATYHDGSTIAYTYDVGDRLTQVVDSANGTITRQYDLLDRLTSETTAQGTVTYAYDAASRRTSMTVSGQPAVTYGYDDANRLTSVTQGTAVVSLTYDAADRRTTLTYPNGIVVTSGYDAADQLTSLTYTLGATTLGTLTYTYDTTGNRTSVGGTWARTGIPSAMASATYDAANRILTWNGTSFAYDFNGNLTSDGASTYNWNARNQLASLTGTMTASFGYDGMARRRTKTVSGVSTHFLYDGLNTVQEQVGGTAANLLSGLGLDEAWQRTSSSGATTLLTDAQGSTVTLTDGFGGTQTTYTYEPFGSTTATGAASENSAQFTGREADSPKMYFYRARYYAATLGRFIQEDPIDFSSGEINLYAYVSNRPVNATDPLGLYSWDEFVYDGVMFSAGLGDGLLLDSGEYLRSLVGLDGVVNGCTGTYAAGQWTSAAAGMTRLGYAAAAKAGSIFAASGAQASAFRATLKNALRFGRAKAWRAPNLAKYPTDAALRAAAGRTNPTMNAYGAGVTAAGVTTPGGRYSACS